MPELSGAIIVKKIKPVVFLIEKTMDPDKSRFIKILLDQIKEIYSEYNDFDYEYQFAFLSFATQTLIHGDRFMDISDVFPSDILNKTQVDVSDFLSVINSGLSRKKMLRTDGSFLVPNIYLLADGNSKYINTEYLQTIIGENKWFKVAKRRVISLGEPSEGNFDFFSQFAVDSGDFITIVEDKLSNNSFIETIAASIFEDLKCVAGLIQDCHKLRDFFDETYENIVYVDPVDEDDWGSDDDW